MLELKWDGKDEALKAAEETKTHLLEFDKNFSFGEKNSGNLIVQGDNLKVLKSLLPFYRGQVKCIYIDPPYNTNAAIENYSDNFPHSDWLSLMYPRLELLRDFLSEDGAIFISIDDTEQAYLKVICDEIFTRKNFVAIMIWKNKSGGANDAKNIACDTEYILVYAKNISNLKLNRDADAKVTTSYNKVDADGRRYSLERLDKQNLGYQSSLDFPITGTDGKIYTVEQKNPDKKLARWRWSKETVQQRYSELVFKYPYVYTKNYEKNEGVLPRNLLTDERFGRTRTGKTELKDIFGNAENFNYPKPTKLIQFFLQIATDKNAIILDAFAGSGTTAHAVLKFNEADSGNRKFILIEEKEYCKTITAERVRRVGGSFDFYRLGEEITDSEGKINSSVTFEQLANFVWFSATKTPLKLRDLPLLGVHEGKAIYLLYDEGKSVEDGNILTKKVLSELPQHDGEKIIYGSACRIDESFLEENKIIFRQIPKELNL